MHSALIVQPLVVVRVGHRLELRLQLVIVVQNCLESTQQTRVQELIQPKLLALLIRAVDRGRD